MRPAVLTAGLAALASAAVTAWRLRRRYLAVTVVGRSMEPAFSAGDVLLARRRIGTVAAGDVVVIGVGAEVGVGAAVGAGGTVGGGAAVGAGVAAGPQSMIVKRVAAVAGDPVPRRTVPALAGVPESVVPAGKLVVLGDNPASTDSRHFGYVDTARIAAVVSRRVRGGRS